MINQESTEFLEQIIQARMDSAGETREEAIAYITHPVVAVALLQQLIDHVYKLLKAVK